MTHYTTNSGSVRIEQFKPNGKWYQTLAGDMSDMYWGGGEHTPKGKTVFLLHEAVAFTIVEAFGQQDNVNWIYAVLDPYHENGYPVLMTSAQVCQHIREWTQGYAQARRQK